MVPFSRMYLGVHTPADVGVSAAVALSLIFGIYPFIQKAQEKPNTMRILMGGMLVLSVLYVVFVECWPFPADTDAHNLANGTKNAYTMLGCILGVWLTYETDTRYLQFRTDGVWWAQILKLLIGLAVLLAIKARLKAPLLALCGGHNIADAARYFLMVVFAGCIWPLTFDFWRMLGQRKYL